MAEEKTEKMVIIATHGGDDPERASLPFVVGNAARAMEVEVIVALQGNGVTLAKKGCYEHVFCGGLDPLKKLVDTFVELGGKIWVCTPCIKSRQIDKEELVDGIELMAGGQLVQACVEADAVLNY
ncbi:MAG: multidrug transporter [Deltaproteobacteria bacterium]|nr:MAG: multidrug transporter [Deltaproteobacteria bacterium]